MSGPDSLHDKVCVITGGSSGIGWETARGLARLGSTTVLVGRGPDRLARAAAEIGRSTGNSRTAWIETSDLASLTEMNRVASEIATKYPRIDVMVHNAGAMYFDREETADGIERTWALNVLAPFVLTVRLAAQLRAAAPSRVVNIASAAYRGQRLDLQDLQLKGSYRGYRAYARSKLALLLLTGELARRFSGSGVTVNAVHPGFVDSGWGHQDPGWRSQGVRIAQRLFGVSTTKGARTSIYAASSPELAGVTGAYLSRERAVRPSRRALDPEVAGALYGACAKLTGMPLEF
jgi:NAD(P)-dependent dehydrogenase (short-subunit alcohol dehydrogenase family)